MEAIEYVRVTVEELGAVFADVAGVLTEDSNGRLLDQDGRTLVKGDRLLLRNGLASAGIFSVTDVGKDDPAGRPFKLQRLQTCDGTAEYNAGQVIKVWDGDWWAHTLWELETNPPIVLDITPLDFAQLCCEKEEPMLQVTVTPWLWDCTWSVYVQGDDFLAEIRAEDPTAEEAGRQVIYMRYPLEQLQLRDPCDSVCCRMDAVSFTFGTLVVSYYVQQIEPRFLGSTKQHRQAVLIRACACGASGSPPPDPPPPDHPPDDPPPPTITAATCGRSTHSVSDAAPNLGDTITIDVIARNSLGVLLPGVAVLPYYTGGSMGTIDGITPATLQLTDSSGAATWTWSQSVAQVDVLHVILNAGQAGEVDCTVGTVVWGGSGGGGGPIWPYWQISNDIIDVISNGTCNEAALVSQVTAFDFGAGTVRSEGLSDGSASAAGMCLNASPLWTMTLSGGIWTLVMDGGTVVYTCPDNSDFDDGPGTHPDQVLTLVSATGKFTGWPATGTLLWRAGP